MSERLARVEKLARARASREPGRAARRLRDLSDEARRARAAEHGDEADRLDAIARGYAGQLRDDTRCVVCGRPLKDPSQPGFASSVGPECWMKT